MNIRRIILLILTVIGLLLLINYGVSLYFYKLAIERGPKDFLQGNEDLKVSSETLDYFLEGDWIEWRDQQAFERFHTKAFDGIDLQGYFLEAKEPTNKFVIFAHGYLGNAFDMTLFGKYYYEELGFHLFTPDLRGHGESGGNYIGFGWHDRLDLIKWVDEIIAQFGEDVEIVLHGLSMGAATVLMVSGEDLPQQVKAIIADSPYTSVYDLFAYQLKRMFHLPDRLFLPMTSVVTKQKANYSLKEASALEQVKKTSVPILYVHGESDTFVPTRMSEELYEATTSEKHLVTFPNSNHGEAVVLHREEFFEVVREFVERYMTN